jgi:hypothetical protein
MSSLPSAGLAAIFLAAAATIWIAGIDHASLGNRGARI